MEQNTSLGRKPRIGFQWFRLHSVGTRDFSNGSPPQRAWRDETVNQSRKNLPWISGYKNKQSKVSSNGKTNSGSTSTWAESADKFLMKNGAGSESLERSRKFEAFDNVGSHQNSFKERGEIREAEAVEEEIVDDPRWDKIKSRFRRGGDRESGGETPDMRRWDKQDNWGRKTWREATDVSSVPKMVGEPVYGYKDNSVQMTENEYANMNEIPCRHIPHLPHSCSVRPSPVRHLPHSSPVRHLPHSCSVRPSPVCHLPHSATSLTLALSATSLTPALNKANPRTLRPPKNPPPFSAMKVFNVTSLPPEANPPNLPPVWLAFLKTPYVKWGIAGFALIAAYGVGIGVARHGRPHQYANTALGLGVAAIIAVIAAIITGFYYLKKGLNVWIFRGFAIVQGCLGLGLLRVVFLHFGM
ncbi:hypothetical protein Syun_011437 [Stephania yunnanensis]|uniref:Uncharacterized protein n=1 Tax=Stephania yunnanensis TaxID=152371 RepID=A0AAP0JZX6_9MAGN